MLTVKKLALALCLTAITAITAVGADVAGLAGDGQAVVRAERDCC